MIEKSFLELVHEFIATSSAEVGEQIYKNWGDIDSDTKDLLFGVSRRPTREEWSEIWANSIFNRGNDHG